MRPKVLALLPLFFFHNASRVLTLTFIWIILLSRIPSSVVSVSDDRRAKSHLLTKKKQKTNLSLDACILQILTDNIQLFLSTWVWLWPSNYLLKPWIKSLMCKPAQVLLAAFLFLSLQSSFSCLQDFINFHLISFHFLFSSFTWTKSRSILHCSVFFPFFFSRSAYMPEHLSVQVTFEYWISRLWW